MPTEYIYVSVVAALKVLSLVLITFKSKYGLPLFFACLGLSSMSFYYLILPGGVGTGDSIEWIAELLYMAVAVFILIFKYGLKVFSLNSNYIVKVFFVVLIVYVVSIRSFDLYMISVLLNALYPLSFYIFIKHFLSDIKISQHKLNNYIFISVAVSLLITLILFLSGYDIYYFESMNGFARFRFFGSLGPLTYSYYLLPFGIYFIVTRRWKYFLLIFLFLAATGSRLNSAILFVAAGFIYLDSKNFFNKKLILTASVVSLALIVVLTVNHFILYNGGRFLFWNVAINEAFMNIWTTLLGNGTGFSKYINYEVFTKYENFPTIHNQFLKISVDTGIILGLLAFLFYPAHAMNQLRKKTDNNLFISFCVISIITIILSSAIADSFSPVIYKPFIVISFFLYDKPIKILS
jgi:hypothetical protein